MAFTPLCSMRGSARVRVDALLKKFLDFLPARKKTARGIHRTYVKETISPISKLPEVPERGRLKRSSPSGSDSIESSAIARIHIHIHIHIQ